MVLGDAEGEKVLGVTGTVPWSFCFLTLLILDCFPVLSLSLFQV
jgi:hypothetical protein